jgi:hypothetical protein
MPPLSSLPAEPLSGKELLLSDLGDSLGVSILLPRLSPPLLPKPPPSLPPRLIEILSLPLLLRSEEPLSKLPLLSLLSLLPPLPLPPSLSPLLPWAKVSRVLRLKPAINKSDAAIPPLFTEKSTGFIAFFSFLSFSP